MDNNGSYKDIWMRALICWTLLNLGAFGSYLAGVDSPEKLIIFGFWTAVGLILVRGVESIKKYLKGG